MPISCMNPSQAISIRLAGTGLNCPVERIGRLCAAVAGGIGLDVLQRRKPLLEPDADFDRTRAVPGDRPVEILEQIQEGIGGTITPLGAVRSGSSWS